MSQFWSDFVTNLDPYTPGEQPKVENLTKLNTNENPYPPSPKVTAAIAAANDQRLRLYPPPNADQLKQTLASYHGLQTSQIFVGNGSDEVLAHVFNAFFKRNKPLLFPDICYSFYPVYCGLFDIAYQQIPLDEQFRIRSEDYRGDIGGIIFPNPNAPTGIGIPLNEVESIVKANPQVVVVIDEAYVDFGGQSAVSLVEHYPNVLVVQTLSKSRSLAGLRVGFAMGSAELIEGLERIKNSFNSYPLGQLAIAGAVASFEDEDYFQLTRAKIVADRQALVEGLNNIGMAVLPSAANFVFATHPTQNALQIMQALREQGIIVRHFNKPRIDQYLRITVGTAEENNRLLAALAEIVA